jgi:Kdo2-lipid IVA lauroyltransferase/acyltransferase
MKNAPTRHAAEYALFQAVRGLVRALPHGSARIVGSALGDVAYRGLTRRRRLALANLELALPALDAAARRRVARGAFRQMMAQAAEFLSWDRLDPVELCRRWRLEGWEHVVGADRESPSTFLMTGHFGHWEIIGPAVSLYAPPVAALVRPLDNPLLEATLAAIRSRFGLTLIHKHGAARHLVRMLQEGGRVVVLLDQRVRPRDAVEIPFFGRPALTSSLVARLALKHGTPVVPVFAYPAPGGTYRIVARPPIEAPAGTDSVRRLTARCLDAVEAEIRHRPELWLWMHDRWKLP